MGQYLLSSPFFFTGNRMYNMALRPILACMNCVSWKNICM